MDLDRFLAIRLGIIRYPALSLEEWRVVRVKGIEATGEAADLVVEGMAGGCLEDSLLEY